MEDDIRNVVHPGSGDNTSSAVLSRKSRSRSSEKAASTSGTAVMTSKSPTTASRKSRKSRAQSTTDAKDKKKKKKEKKSKLSDVKSKSKSMATATTTKKRSKKSNATSSSSTPTNPTSMTLNIPASNEQNDSAVAADDTKRDLRRKSSVSEHLKDILENNDQNLVTLSASPSILPTTSTATSKVSNQDNDKSSLSSKNNQIKAAARTALAPSSNKKSKNKKKQKNDQKLEEKKKRRERLMVSPFEYLQIENTKRSSTNNSGDEHSLFDFQDDVSFITLPKPLRELEEQATSPRSDSANGTGNNATTAAAAPAEVAVTAGAAPATVPGWSRKAHPPRKLVPGDHSLATDAKTSTDPLITKAATIPTFHSHQASPATTPTTIDHQTGKRSQTRDPKSVTSPNKEPTRNLPLQPSQRPSNRKSQQEQRQQLRKQQRRPTLTDQSNATQEGKSGNNPNEQGHSNDSAKNANSVIPRESSDLNPKTVSYPKTNSPTQGEWASGYPEAAPLSFPSNLQSTILQKMRTWRPSIRRHTSSKNNNPYDVEQPPAPNANSQKEKNPVQSKDNNNNNNDNNNNKSNGSERGRRFWWLFGGAICCVLFIVIMTVILIMTLGKDRDDNQNNKGVSSTNDNGRTEKKEFQYESPLEPVEPDTVTTKMALLDFNCNHFDDQTNSGSNSGNAKFSHVWDQCQCEDSAQYLPQDIMDMRELLLEHVIPELYGPLEDLGVPPVSSCHPANQALLWLASGDNRNVGYMLQRFILAVFFFETVGPEWDYQDNWLSSNHECLWLGIQCNSYNVITSIALDTNNIHGTVPTEFGRLEGLQGFSMSRNHLRGTLPTELISLPRLQEVWLYANQLNGPIPSEIGYATSLQSLLLQTNFLGGSLPTELGRLTAMTNLNLGFNDYGRSLPSELGQLTRLQFLTLADNRLTGRIPPEVGLLESLQNMTLSQNDFYGSLPSTIGMLQELQDLRMNNAGIGGTIPTELGLLSELRIVRMVQNILRGLLPTELGRLSKLQELQLYSNRLEGPIPTQLGSLGQWNMLEELRLDDNLLTGTIPSDFGRMTLLQYLSLDGNELSGSIPSSLCVSVQNGPLETLVVDCPNGRTGLGIDCVEEGCCTFCRAADR